MILTEKSLREALEFARDKIYREICKQGKHDDPDNAPTIKRIDEALAAIPSETEWEDELAKLKRDLAFKQLCIDELRDANRAFYSSHASLRERVVEECAECVNRYGANGKCEAHVEAFKQLVLNDLRALAKSPPVSGKKEKSDG